MALAQLVAAAIDNPTLTNWGAPQTTNLGVSGSNLFGRTIHVDLVDPDIDVRSEGSLRLMRP